MRRLAWRIRDGSLGLVSVLRILSSRATNLLGVQGRVCWVCKVAPPLGWSVPPATRGTLPAMRGLRVAVTARARSTLYCCGAGLRLPTWPSAA
jgi:hypothetical protein